MRVIAEGLAFPEGPVALDDGSIAVVQMAADLVSVIAPDGMRRDLPCPGGPNGMALEPDGEHVIICRNGGLAFSRDRDGRLLPGCAVDESARGGLARLSLRTGGLAEIIPSGPESPTSGPNDVALSPSSSCAGEGIWFTDLGRRLVDRIEPGGVFWRGVDGRVVRAAYPRPGRPNGIALSGDGSTVYVTESLSAQVWAWPVLGPGQLGSAQLVHEFPAPVRLDGMALTAAGNLVVATLVVGELTTLSPRGKVLDRVAVDDPMPTNVCFTGPDHADLVVTLGSTGRVIQVPWTEPGAPLN